MENLEDDKGANEISRIPSPASVSSIHSVRPLEWDSGADIGYRCKESSSLSTVERMALVRGTVNLLETCQPPTTTKSFSPPLAHSSPFVNNVYTSRRSSTEVEKPVQRLVDYTIGDDDSFRKTSSYCKSLDDLRRAVRKRDALACKCASRSSNNLATPKSSCHLSTSSLVTILGSGKYSNKAVQVNEGSLVKPSSKSGSTSTSGVRSSIISTDNPTYTIEDDKIQSVNTSDDSCNRRSRATNLSQSNGNSSDKGSFEYVRGSVYDQRDGSRKSNPISDSDVDTLCSEVVDGVELVTKYVNNLRLSNKSKVIRKIVVALASNLNRTESSENSNVNNGVTKSENQTRISTCSKDIAVPSHTVLSSNRTSSGEIPVTSSSINNSVSISGVSRTVSDVSTENQFSRGLKFRQSKSSDSSTNIGPLKEFLEKERETQLLWIKSGIDHLNNLKKLYENQKLLKENLRSLKKRQTIEITSVRTNSQKRSPNSRSRSSDPSSKCQFSRHKVDNSSVSTEASHRSNKIEISKTSSALLGRIVTHSSNKKRTHSCSIQRKRNGKFHEECVENKENIPQNPIQQRPDETRPKLKAPVSYTVLFDKKPSYFASQNYTVKEEIRNEVHQENLRRKTYRKTHGVSKSLAKPGLTLHDYLLKNKPEYVNKAEGRRKCLEKISKLRNLRDQNRSEVLATLNNEPDKVNCIVPPPLSIIRIFDDRSIKQSTARKYQQLPEVQNKKLELKREEHFRRNRIMAKIFTKKLQKKVLKGQVNLSNTVNLISV